MKRRLITAPLVMAGMAGLGMVATAMPAAALPTSGNETFTVTQTSATGPQRVFATGPISGVGVDIEVSDTEDQFFFPAGSVTVDHEPTTSSDSYDPTTCIFRYTESGTYVIVGGAGAYANVSGSGTYKVTVAGRGCDPYAPPNPFTLVVWARGPISLGEM